MPNLNVGMMLGIELRSKVGPHIEMLNAKLISLRAALESRTVCCK